MCPHARWRSLPPGGAQATDRQSRIRACPWLGLPHASVSDDFGGFAPPPYRTEDALLRLKRALRDLKLTERSGGFEWQGCRVAEITVAADSVLAARLARRATRRTPDWDLKTLKSAADERQWLDELRRRLARWTPED